MDLPLWLCRDDDAMSVFSRRTALIKSERNLQLLVSHRDLTRPRVSSASSNPEPYSFRIKPLRVAWQARKHGQRLMAKKCNRVLFIFTHFLQHPIINLPAFSQCRSSKNLPSLHRKTLSAASPSLSTQPARKWISSLKNCNFPLSSR